MTITTVTLNPSLDLAWTVDAVNANDKLRTEPERADPGGGGVNVSRVCRRLGEDTVAVVALGGTTGAEVSTLLRASGIPLQEVKIADPTRQSVTVSERRSPAQYRFVLPGPNLTASERDAVKQAMAEAACDGGTVVISGSMPPGIPDDFLTQLIESLPGRTLDPSPAPPSQTTPSAPAASRPCRVFIDTSGAALVAALSSGADLLKPSAKELASLVDRELETEADVIRAADEVMASANVGALVASLGPGGAYAVNATGERYRFHSPAVKVRSAVGAGDSMVAGLAVAAQRGADFRQMVSYGIAAGTAAVLTEGTELCRPADIGRLLPHVASEVVT